MSEVLSVQRFFTTDDLRAFKPDAARTTFAILDRPDFCKFYLFVPKSQLPDDNADVIQPTIQECCLGTRGRWEICFNSKLQGSGSAPSTGAHAATIIVDQSGNGDALTIAAGLALLPAGGGMLYVREGIYPISATLAMPDADVAIVGTGSGSVVINLGANAIAAFTMSSATDRSYLFKDFRVDGTNIAGQSVWRHTGANAGTKPLRVENVNVANILSSGLAVEKIFERTAGAWVVEATNCDFHVGGLAGSAVVDGIGTVNMIGCRTFGTGRFLGNPVVKLADCDLANLATERYAFGNGSVVKGCTFSGGGIVEVPQQSRFAGCRFSAGQLEVQASVTRATITGNIFEAVQARHIDMLTGAAGVTVTGNTFSGQTSEAIRMDATDCHVHGNGNCSVTETGASARNRFSQIDAANSTLIGDDSEVWATAATVVVDQDGNADAVTIAEGLLRLQDIGGGTLFLREGTYTITSQLSIPNTSDGIVIRGAGREATIIDIGANVITLFFASGQFNPIDFSDFTARANDDVNQNFFRFTASGSALRQNVSFRRIRIGAGTALGFGRVIFNSTAAPFVPWRFSFWDCEIFSSGTFTHSGITIQSSATGTNIEAHFTRCRIAGNGGYDRVSAFMFLHFVDSEIAIDEEVDVSSIDAVNTRFTRSGLGVHTSTITLIAKSRFVGCSFERSGEVTNDILLQNVAGAASKSEFIGCRFNEPEGSTAGADHIIRIEAFVSSVKIIACQFGTSSSPIAVSEIRSAGDNLIVSSCRFEQGTTPVHVDLEALAVAAQITGNIFGGIFTAIRIATNSCNVVGNQGCEVEEIGAADINDYSGNSGFGGSTIIGSQSRVNGMVSKAVDPAVTDDEPIFFPGDRWRNTATGEVFVNVDNSPGAAVWNSVTGGAGTPFDPQNAFVYSMMNSLM